MTVKKFREALETLEKNTFLAGHASAFEDGDLSIIKYQDGANGEVKEKVRVVMSFDDSDIAVEILPK